MLSIRSGGIWPRRTPARQGFRAKTDAPLVLGQDLDAQSAPSVRKSPDNAFSVRISPKNERRIQNVKLGNVKLASNWGVKLGQSHFDQFILTNLIFAHYPYAAALSTQASALRLRG